METLGLSRVCALVVDDSEIMRALMTSILRRLGVGAIVTAEEGGEGLRIVRAQEIDIAFVDWMMTPVDGIAFTRAVRTAPDSPNPYLPIVMVTGHTEASRIRQARDAGITEFLAKPVSARGVYQRIYSVVETPRPFARTESYFGPDRRRQTKKPLGAERRAKRPASA
jgi:CheY-like chemotaxis protein